MTVQKYFYLMAIPNGAELNDFFFLRQTLLHYLIFFFRNKTIGRRNEKEQRNEAKIKLTVGESKKKETALVGNRFIFCF